MAETKASETGGRRKLIDTARRLFSQRGTAHVGINEIGRAHV